MTINIDDAVRAAFAVDENHTPLSDVVRMGRARRRGRRTALVAGVAALAAVAAGLLLPSSHRTTEPAGPTPAQVRAFDARCRQTLVPADAKLAVFAGRGAALVFAYTEDNGVYECTTDGSNLNRYESGTGLHATSLGRYGTSITGLVTPAVTAVDVTVNGVTGHATIANGAFAWIGSGRSPADGDVIALTEHTSDMAYTWSTVGIESDSDAEGTATACLDATRRILAEAPGLSPGQRRTPVSVIASVARPGLWMAVVAGDGALAVCDPSGTAIWLPTTPYSGIDEIVNFVGVIPSQTHEWAAGHVPHGTTAVDVVLPDGRPSVRATLHDGFYLATWDGPGTLIPVRIVANTPSGAVTLPIG